MKLFYFSFSDSILESLLSVNVGAVGNINVPLSFTAHTVWLAGSQSQLFLTVLIFSPLLHQELIETDLSEFLQIHRRHWGCTRLPGGALVLRLQTPEVPWKERRLGTKSIASAEKVRNKSSSHREYQSPTIMTK